MKTYTKGEGEYQDLYHAAIKLTYQSSKTDERIKLLKWINNFYNWAVAEDYLFFVNKIWWLRDILDLCSAIYEPMTMQKFQLAVQKIIQLVDKNKDDEDILATTNHRFLTLCNKMYSEFLVSNNDFILTANPIEADY